MEMAARGEAILVISNVLIEELDRAPKAVQEILPILQDEYMEPIRESPEADRLRDLYLASGVVGKTHATDALHVALATVARVDMIVSWNFKHIVHFEKIRGFNAVNLREGYAPITIFSPLEVV